MENEKSMKELTITRTFNAPRDMVWKAWTDQSLIAQWWGPRGVTNPTCIVDARTGGKMNIVMRASKEMGEYEGMEWPMTGTFDEVTPKSRIVFTGQAIDDNASKQTLIESKTAVDFEEMKDKTKVTVHISVMFVSNSEKAKAAIYGMEQGWNQQMDKLGEFVQR